MADEILVFDTGPLLNFAQKSWLGLLKAVVGDRQAMVPDVVVEELKVSATRGSGGRAVLDTRWIEHRELRSPEEVAAFARFSERLVRGDRNRGEAGVLALALTVGGVAVIDDAAGRMAAERNGIRLRPTLKLLLEAVGKELVTVKLVSHLADDLLANSYRLPFPPGGFEKWAAEQGYT